MKKEFLFSCILIICSAFLAAQTLDEALLTAAVKFGRDLPAGSKVAINSFTSPSERTSNYVISELSGYIIRNRKLIVVTPNSGQNAEYLINGSLTLNGIEYKLILNVIDSESAQVQSQYTASINLQNDEQLAILLGIMLESASKSSKQGSSGSGKSGSQSSKNQRVRKTRPSQQADVRDNWVSAVLSYGYPSSLSTGIQYERMLGSKISIGGDFYWLFPLYSVSDSPNGSSNKHDDGNNFGIDAFFHFYPAGKAFYLGLALGYYNVGNESIGGGMKNEPIYETIGGESFLTGYKRVHYTDYANIFGLGISAKLGWKIDVGKEGGFFMQPGLSFTFVFSNHKVLTGDVRNYLNEKIYLGAGWAF